MTQSTWPCLAHLVVVGARSSTTEVGEGDQAQPSKRLPPPPHTGHHPSHPQWFALDTGSHQPQRGAVAARTGAVHSWHGWAKGDLSPSPTLTCLW